MNEIANEIHRKPLHSYLLIRHVVSYQKLSMQIVFCMLKEQVFFQYPLFMFFLLSISVLLFQMKVDDYFFSFQIFTSPLNTWGLL